MAVENNPTTLDGDFKNLYKKMGLANLIPADYIVQKRWPWKEQDATGSKFVIGVVLRKEHGFSYAPSSGTYSGAITLNASIAGFVGKAEVEGWAIYGRSRLSYDAAAKASKAGEKAFASAYGAVLKNLKESHHFRLEHSLLYGKDGVAVVTGSAAGQVVSILASSWSTGLLASGMTGAVLECWTATTEAATQHNGDMTIESVDVLNKALTITETVAAVANADVLYFKGARNSSRTSECFGLRRIMATTTGNMFSIPVQTYELWKCQTKNIAGAISFTQLMAACALGIPYGLKKAVALINEVKFAVLATNEAALRRYVKDTPDVKRGVKGIVFQLGAVDLEIMPHPLIREGDCMIIPDDNFELIGASGVTLGMPGAGSDMQVHVADTTALEIRSMSDMQGFISTPAQAILCYGIT